MKIKKKSLAILILTTALMLGACRSRTESTEQKAETAVTQEAATTETATTAQGTASAEDSTDQTADTPQTAVTTQSAAQNETFRITSGGTYTYTGTINETISIDTTDDVEIVLDNVRIETENVCIFSMNGDLTLTLAGDNVLKNTTANTITYEDEDIDAVIYCKDDLVITGDGSLTVEAHVHGIVSKDALTLNANVTVDSNNTAIRGKDMILVDDEAVLSLNAGTDGLKSDGDTGTVEIDGGSIQITAGDKGIQSEAQITIKSGSLSVSSANDGIHSNGSIDIDGGSIEVVSDDDAVHADAYLTVTGGNLDLDAHECLEATVVTISGGVINMVASDDGINAAYKADGVYPEVTISGGEISITMGEGDTDGIDSNGNLTITGGIIDITARSPFDYDGQGSYTGGELIVNGQQVTDLYSQFGGRGGFGGGRGGGRGGR